MTMKCNVGRAERIIRICSALVCAALGAGLWKGFYVASAVLLFTALIAWCPITAALGISTCKEVDREDIPADTAGTDKDELTRQRRFK
jgi:hypothetical protein